MTKEDGCQALAEARGLDGFLEEVGDFVKAFAVC